MINNDCLGFTPKHFIDSHCSQGISFAKRRCYIVRSWRGDETSIHNGTAFCCSLRSSTPRRLSLPHTITQCLSLSNLIGEHIRVMHFCVGETNSPTMACPWVVGKLPEGMRARVRWRKLFLPVTNGVEVAEPDSHKLKKNLSHTYSLKKLNSLTKLFLFPFFVFKQYYYILWLIQFGQAGIQKMRKKLPPNERDDAQSGRGIAVLKSGKRVRMMYSTQFKVFW